MSSRRLIVIDNNALESGVLRAVPRPILKLLCHSLTKDEDVLAPEFLVPYCKTSGNVWSWDSLKNLGDCHHDPLTELFNFNNQCIEILENQPAAWIGSLSLPKALSYGFMASHTEDLPFFTHGLKNFLKKENYQEITLVDGPRSQSLTEDIAKRLEIRLSRKFFPLSYLVKASVFVEQVKPYKPSGALVHYGKSDGELFWICSKARTKRWLKPLWSQLERQGKSHQGFSVHGFQPKQLSSHQSVIEEIWRTAEPELRRIALTYEGVGIAGQHLNVMKKEWLKRAAVTRAFAFRLKEVKATVKTKVFLLDPLEASWVLSEWAKENRAKRYFYYSMFNGFVSTAEIWESHLRSMGDRFFTVNEWMKKRLLEKGIKQVEVVGDVLQEAAKASSTPTRSSTSQKVIGVFSRAVSSALTSKEKIFLLHSVYRAARQHHIKMVVKPHPHEDLQELRTHMQRAGVDCEITGASLEDCLSSIDLLVTYPYGSAATDALSCKIPVLLVGSESQLDRVDQLDGPFSLRKYGAALGGTTYEEISEAVRTLLFDEIKRSEHIISGQDFLLRISGFSDGRAVERIVESIIRD